MIDSIAEITVQLHNTKTQDSYQIGDKHLTLDITAIGEGTGMYSNVLSLELGNRNSLEEWLSDVADDAKAEYEKRSAESEYEVSEFSFLGLFGHSLGGRLKYFGPVKLTDIFKSSENFVKEYPGVLEGITENQSKVG